MDPKHLIRVPLTRQSTTYTCGISALQSVLGYYGIFYREDVLADKLEASPDLGTKNWKMVEFANSVGLQAETKLDLSIQDLEDEIDKGNPVIVAIQAWKSNDDNKPWNEMWDNGHYVVTIGYDSENLYFMDPSTLANYTYIPKQEFLERWHDIDQNDKKVIHLGILISNPNGMDINDQSVFRKIN